MNTIKEFFFTIGEKIRGAWERMFPGRAGRAPDSGEEPHGQADETRLFDARELQKQHRDAHNENEPLFTEKERRRPFILSVLFTTIRFLLVGAVLAGFALLGAGIGVAKAYVETTPDLDRAQLTKSDRTSFLYDMDGALITSIAQHEYRDWVDIEDIPEMVQHAFVAVEDIRFYKHSGVDIKRLFSAMLEVLGNSNATGGSTITQQLIKNKILGNERTYRRKIQEAYLALELEKDISKEDILEAYLNDIHLGGSNYGVKTAAQDYFGKELKDLTIRECALLAGLTQNPYAYNPRLNKYKRDESRWEDTVNRTNKVLGSMYQAGYITTQEYEAALLEDVYIVPVSEQQQMYDMPYFVEYAIRDVVTHMLAQEGLTEADRSAMENKLRTGGYHIYTTADRSMQELVQDTLSTWENYPALYYPNKSIKYETLSNGDVMETKQPQASAVVLDHNTGELRAIVGGRDLPTIRKGFNRAYQGYVEVGSSIKPLAVYGPAFDAGASPASIVGNFEAPIEGWTKDPGYPYIGDSSHIGPLSMRQGIVSSLNVMAARTLMEWVRPEVGAQYLANLGANSGNINQDGPGLALGTSTLTPIQMAAAFGTIASGGEYKEPLSFTKVVDGEGNVVLDAEQVRQRRQVFKPSTAYMLVDVLTDAVQRGTGRKARIDDMTVAGKTGTNSDYRSVFFAGMTPYYTGTVWIGHDEPGESFLKNRSTGGDYAAPLWQAFMSEIHGGLPKRDIITDSPSSLGLVKKTVCAVSGMLPTDACYADQAGHTPITDWMLEEHAPTATCDMHAAVAICSESGMVASEDCPETSITSGSVVLVTPGSYYDQFTDEELLPGLPNFIRTTVPLEYYVDSLVGYTSRCTWHGEYSSLGGTDGLSGGESLIGSTQPLEDRTYELNDLKRVASQLRAEMHEYSRSRRLMNADSATLGLHINKLESLATSFNTDVLRSAINEAYADYQYIRRSYESTTDPADDGDE